MTTMQAKNRTTYSPGVRPMAMGDTKTSTPGDFIPSPMVPIVAWHFAQANLSIACAIEAERTDFPNFARVLRDIARQHFIEAKQEIMHQTPTPTRRVSEGHNHQRLAMDAKA